MFSLRWHILRHDTSVKFAVLVCKQLTAMFFVYTYFCLFQMCEVFGVIPDLNLVLLNCCRVFFINLKLELLTQFPFSNNEKYLCL